MLSSFGYNLYFSKTMSIKRIFLFFIFGIVSLILFWCWNKDNIEVSFDNFKISLDNNFKEFNTNNFENIWKIEKIIKSLKRKNDNWYIENIIISKSNNANKITTENYASANIDKIKKELIWHKSIKSNSFEFTCKWEKINVIRNYFGITDNIFDNNSKINYYIQQYYFQKNNYLYIISYTSDNKENIEIIDWYVNKIKCE